MVGRELPALINCDRIILTLGKGGEHRLAAGLGKQNRSCLGLFKIGSRQLTAIDEAERKTSVLF